jgi:ribosomal protein S18 acetylase RimI-like enzyme
MEIRRLRSDDAALAKQAIVTLKSDIDTRVAHRLAKIHLSNFLSRESNILLVALEQNKPIGFALAYRLERVDREQDMVLFYEIEVDTEHRSRGVGSALISALKDICSEKPTMKMWVYTDASNVAAMQLYRATGGSMCERAHEIKFTYYCDREQTQRES